MDAPRSVSMPYPAPPGLDDMPMKVKIMPVKVKIPAASPLWGASKVSCDTTSSTACDSDNERTCSETGSSQVLETPIYAAAYTPLRSQATPFLPQPACSPGPAATTMMGQQRLQQQPTMGQQRLQQQPAMGERQSKTKKNAKKQKGEEVMTTVMLCNLPFDQTKDTLIDLMDSMGFRGQYDFVYVPMNVAEMRSVGYGFINLSSHALAKTFMSAFQGFKGWASELQCEPCEFRWSSCNGLEANVKRHRHSPVMADSVPDVCKPVLLKDGVRIPFPDPVRKIRTMRIRKGKAQEDSHDVALEEQDKM